jgi:hypothetical protein
MTSLQELGINIGLLISGFFGSLLTLGRHRNWRTAVVAVLSGMGSSNYLTPIVIDLSPVMEHSQYAVAFVLGFLGLRGVELITDKLFPDQEDGDTRND